MITLAEVVGPPLRRWVCNGMLIVMLLLMTETQVHFASAKQEYVVITTTSPITFVAAEALCKARRGWLATFPDLRAWQVFHRLNPTSPSGSNRYWIGGSDLDDEGTWRWNAKDSPYEFEGGGKGRVFYTGGGCVAGAVCKWGGGQPDDGFFFIGTEDHLEMSFGSGTGTWNDAKGTSSIDGAICQFNITRTASASVSESFGWGLTGSVTTTDAISITTTVEQTQTLPITNSPPLTVSETLSLSVTPSPTQPTPSLSLTKPRPLPSGACPWALMTITARYAGNLSSAVAANTTGNTSVGNSTTPTPAPAPTTSTSSGSNDGTTTSVVFEGNLTWLDQTVVPSEWVLAAVPNNTVLSGPAATPIPVPSGNRTSGNFTTTTAAPRTPAPTTAVDPSLKLSLQDWKYFTDSTLTRNDSIIPRWSTNMATMRPRVRPTFSLTFMPRSCQRFLDSALSHVSVGFDNAPTFKKFNADILKASNGSQQLFRWSLMTVKELRLTLNVPLPLTFHLLGNETLELRIGTGALEGGYDSQDSHRFLLTVATDRSWAPVRGQSSSSASGGVALGASISGSGGTINAAQRNRLLSTANKCPAAIEDLDYVLLDDLLGLRIPGALPPFDVSVGVAVGNFILIVGMLALNFIPALLVCAFRSTAGDQDEYTLWDALGRVRFPGRGYTAGLLFMPPAVVSSSVVLLHGTRETVPMWVTLLMAAELTVVMGLFLLAPMYIIFSSRFHLSASEMFEPKAHRRRKNWFLRFILRRSDWDDSERTTVYRERLRALREQKWKCWHSCRSEIPFDGVVRHFGHAFDENLSGAKEFSIIETLGTVAACAIQASFPATEEECETSYIVIVVLLGAIFLCALITRPYAAKSMNCFMISAYLLQATSATLLWFGYVEKNPSYGEASAYTTFAATALMILLLVIKLSIISVSVARSCIRRYRRSIIVIEAAKASSAGRRGIFAVDVADAD